MQYYVLWCRSAHKWWAGTLLMGEYWLATWATVTTYGVLTAYFCIPLCSVHQCTIDDARKTSIIQYHVLWRRSSHWWWAGTLLIGECWLATWATVTTYSVWMVYFLYTITHCSSMVLPLMTQEELPQYNTMYCSVEVLTSSELVLSS